MAEDNIAHEKSENKRNEIVKSKQTYCTPTFNNFDLFCILFSFGTFVADISTDIILVVEYSLCGHIGWAVSTLLLMLLPASVVQLFSLRWHKLDEQISVSHYVFHACLLGIIQRYYTVVRSGFEARTRKDLLHSQRLHQQQNDLYILHLLESFIESAPQLILQLYIMLNTSDWYLWTGLSVGTSLCSLTWSIVAYTQAMRRFHPDEISIRWPVLILQTLWQSAMLVARISAMVLFALVFRYWFFLVIGLHWIGMTAWTIFQDTDISSIVWEERIYNAIVAIIYCFSYFNICEKCSRRRVYAFYLIIVTQNVACLVLIISLNLISSFEIIIVMTVLITGGTVIGLISLTLYFTKFHPVESVSCCLIFHDIERNPPQRQKDTTNSVIRIQRLRSLKHLWTIDRTCLHQIEGVSLKGSPRSDDGCTDKKLLLENWIARSGSPTFASVPISQDPVDLEQNNIFNDIEFHTVANSLDSSYDRGVLNEGYRCTESKSPDTEKLNSEKQKRRGICSPTELALKLLQCSEEIKHLSNDSVLTSQKRRGICSSDQLVLDLNSVTLTDVNVNDDIKLKRRPIYSVGSSLNSFNSDLNSKNLYSVRLVKLSDDRSVCSKPEEYMEVASEVLSAHDYENICAVNIARERWGIRSWEGYTDIETLLHDDSTVRDRRRDTLTSTVTGTSASSEISSSDMASSPPPLIPNRKPRSLRSRQDDYLDTLVYDLVDCDKRRVHFLDCNEEHEAESNIFIAKPYVVDQHGMLFPLGSALEPIEELEEPILISSDANKQQTQSSLVTTIDEIRRGNDTDSPRHVYHRTENVWDDDVNLMNNLQDTKTLQTTAPKSVVKSLWHHYPSNKLINNTIMQDIKNLPKETTKSPKITKDLLKQLENNSIGNVNKINSLTNLRKDVTEKLPLSPKKLCEADSVRNKKNENKPRRKFSLLREKFEPKVQQDDILNSSSFEMGSTVNLIDDLKSAKFTSSVITKVVHWNNTISGQNKEETVCDGQLSLSDQDSCNNVADRPALSSLRDKRNIFLKQVLSPPKFHNRKKPVNK